MKIQQINKTPNFLAKLSEKEIITGISTILEKKGEIPVVKKNINYFQDMLKGTAINPFRKAEIDEWIKDKESQYANFDFVEEKRKVLEYIEYEKNKNLNKIKQLVHKVEKFIKKDKNLSHPLMKQLLENAKNAGFFQKFTDLFNSYLELTPKGESKTSAETTISENNISNIENVYKTINVETKPASVGLSNSPKQLLNITEADAKDLLSQYRAVQAKRKTFKPRAEMTTEQEVIEWLKFNNEEYYPIIDKIKEHNISVIKKKEFSPNPLEQVKEKHDYIQYEVLYYADMNEASLYDAMEMFDKYGKREGYEPLRGGISTLSQLKSSLPKNPTEASVTKLIKLYGKHADNFVFPDERDGAPNCIVYEQNFLQVAKKAKTVEQAKLILENGRRMFWSDDNINQVANAWMVNKDAPFKGNNEVIKILDEMFECAEKNRKPFMDCKELQDNINAWHINKRYKKN